MEADISDEELDEGLDILTGLWKGQPFNYHGTHYKIKETDFMPPPPPVQQPRIPIWVVGAWPRLKSMRRVLRYDGLLPNKLDEDGNHQEITPADIREMKSFIESNRESDKPFDIVVEGETPGDDLLEAKQKVQPWSEAGATWWIEALWEAPRDQHGQKLVLERVENGPPK